MNPDQGTCGPFSTEALEFPAIVGLVGRFLSGPLARPLLAAVEPGCDIEKIQEEIALASEAHEYLLASPRPSLAGLAEPRPILEKLRIESCTGSEILAVDALAGAACSWRGLFAKTPLARLNGLARRIPDLASIVKELQGKILPDGSLDSSASPALARIRRSIAATRSELQSRLEAILHRLGRADALQDDVITLRNGRFVLPVKAEKKRQVEGVVHGASSSGQSVFLEPLETLPLNNELVELEDRERLEVERVLDEWSAMLRARRPELLSAVDALSALDLAFAKAEFARRYSACFPAFSSGRELELCEAVHPLLIEALRPLGRAPVPLTVKLAPPETMVIISGPNTGGKTVAIKTVGVAVLMAQAGLPVTASEARVPLFYRVSADIGDQQSIEQNLSTFSAHVRNVEAIIGAADEKCLALLDEIGGSTDPAEGAALAIAVLERLRQSGAMVFVSTHHSRLKAYAAGNPQALNAAMDFDDTTLQPTYRFQTGLPGKSSGLDIALRLGLDPAIVAQARALLSPAETEADSLLTSLHAQRARLEAAEEQAGARARELDRRAEALERESVQARAARLRELDQRFEKALREYTERWKAAIEDIRRSATAAPKPARALGVAARQGERIASDAREEWNAQALEALHPPTESAEKQSSPPATVGSRVAVPNLATPGEVTAELANGEIEVEVGRLHMRVPRDSVRVLLQSSEPGRGSGPRGKAAGIPRTDAATPSAAPQATSAPPRAAPADAEINVIGATADEALARVDKFLDSAFLSGHRTLRVVHGYGKGVLRKALQEMFRGHVHVERFYPAPPKEGGEGVTMVEIKR